MNVTKYADLSQSLAESEKQLCDKISEECASNFEIAIHDSIKKIKSNADSMTEVVDKIQSCKDSYGEAAELVKKLSTTLADTEKNVMGLNSELVHLSETTGGSTSDLLRKISELLELSDNLTVKNKENEIVMEDTCKNIQKLGEEYSSSIESAIKAVKELEAEINSTEEKIMEYTKQFSDGSNLFSAKTESSITLLNDLSSRVETLKSCLELLFASISENKEKLIAVTSDIKVTEEKIATVGKSFGQLEEKVADYNKHIIEEIDKYLSSINREIEVVVAQTDKFSEVLLQNSAEVTGVIECQQKWKESCEVSFTKVLKNVDCLLADLEEKKNLIISETQSMQEYQITIMSCVNDVKSRTTEYVETIQKVNSSLLESFNVFKNDFLSTYDEQSRMIGELKEEQIKLKKMYMLGIIPTIIIVVLQIVNIIC